MAYTPPVGTADLALVGSYTPPVGTVDLDLGATAEPERTAVIAGVTAPPTGVLAALKGSVAVIAGVTAAPTGSISARRVLLAVLAGTTAAPTGSLQSTYDPNLLSDVTLHARAPWQDGAVQPLSLREDFKSAPLLQLGGMGRWQEADSLPAGSVTPWQSSERLEAPGIDAWQEAMWQGTGKASVWRHAALVERGATNHWQDAENVQNRVVDRFKARLPMPVPAGIGRWQQGVAISLQVLDGMQDGLHLIAVEVEVWQKAGYPSNAANPSKDPIQIPLPWPWGTNLHLRCPLPGTRLRIGRSPCILIAEREIPVRRTYMSTNSAALVRLPDLTPLPVIALSVETDFDSWCWGLSATLAGPDAFALVQPNPLACEVMATINDIEWRFLLDVPSTNRSFNSDRVTLKGRSRSAWLHDPYTPSSDRSESNAREMVQLAEAALYNTGWTIDWQLDNWVVPAGRYVSWNTPIGTLLRLVGATDDGLYSDPALQVLTARKRWPVASWLLDAETVDLLIPEAAVISLTQSPLYTQPYNGVYVSGTSHGALALVKITGTDGALQPKDPVVDELLCDEAGVGARGRGLNLLSDSGAGWDLNAEVLLTEEIGLIRPGMIVSIAGIKGISRSCRIQANWDAGGLSVRQTVGLERREVEA